MTSGSDPIWIAEVELADPIVVSGVSRPQRSDDPSARILVRLHHQLLGFISVPLHGTAPNSDTVVAAVRAQLPTPLARHLERDGLPPRVALGSDGIGNWDVCVHTALAGSEQFISVVVCTRDRPEMLASCLRLLGQLQYGDFEVVVVDNAPTTNKTQECFARVAGHDPRFRYVREPAPGLSKARNRGLHEAVGPRVAFTDDDVQVDRWWLKGIAAGFACDSLVGCVTGLAAPAELDHPSQQYFDRRYTWAAHMDCRIFDLAGRGDSSSLYPYSAGIYGTGANFAVDRALFEGLGGFDEALGAGSPAGGGEDLDAFVRILRAGCCLVYEPSAIVWHVHRADASALRRQLFYYGVGLTAFLAKHMTSRRTSIEILRRVPAGLRRAPGMWSPGEIGHRAPAVLVVSEVLGMFCGPAQYIRGRRRLKRAAPEGEACEGRPLWPRIPRRPGRSRPNPAPPSPGPRDRSGPG